MQSIDHIITVASWEERFVLGVGRLVNQIKPSRLIMYYYSEYSKQSKSNRHAVIKLCEDNNVQILERMISFEDPSDNWKILEGDLYSSGLGSKDVLVDISTMPRDTIWTLFFLLEIVGASVWYVYNRPLKYSSEWLSRDPGLPRMVFKMSGIYKFGLPTAIIAITGFDARRTEQIINYFEPKAIYLGLQTGEQYENKRLNVIKHTESSKAYMNIELFDIDSYSRDHGFSDIELIFLKLKDDYNVILASLGPKPSSVALYKLQKKYPCTGLAYAPSREFNLEYSSGISGESEICHL